MIRLVGGDSAAVNRSETAMRCPALAALLLCGVIAASTAACSTSGTAATPQTPTTAAPTTAAPTTAAVTSEQASNGGTPAPSSSVASGGSDGTLDVCSLMSPAAVSAASGLSLTAAVDGSHDTPGVTTCIYSGDDPTVSIQVVQAPDKDGFDDLVTSLGGDIQPVAGIGDKASVSPAGILVQVGSRFIRIESAITNADNEAGYQSLAKAAIASLT